MFFSNTKKTHISTVCRRVACAVPKCTAIRPIRASTIVIISSCRSRSRIACRISAATSCRRRRRCATRWSTTSSRSTI